MKFYGHIFLLLLALARGTGHAADYAVGVDLSFMKQAEDRGTVFKDGTNARPRIMIHIDHGGDRTRTKCFFNKLNTYGVDYDVIGQSYYPWWHGALLDLRENLNFMATTYQKDIILVEVAYCWRPTEYRNKPAPFPETPEGQRQFLDEVNRLVLATPNHRGIGIFGGNPPWQTADFAIVAFSTTMGPDCR